MKKILLMITMVLGISVLAQAQTAPQKGQRTPEQKAANIGKMLQTKLALSADQSAKVNAILLSRATQMESLRANKTGDKKANREAFKSLLMKTDGELAAVFNPEQKKTYDELKTNFKGMHKGGRGVMARNGKGRAHNPATKAQHMTAMLQKKLNLSADQSVKVNAILLNSATQMDSLANNKAAGDRKTNHESREMIMQKTDASLQTVLTADQLKAYAQIKAEMKERHKNRKDVMAPPAAGK